MKNNSHLARERLKRMRSLMGLAVRDGLVTGYSDLVGSLTLPDGDDRHVLAAKIRAGASVIVTFNLSDFPPEIPAPHGVMARHPDPLLDELLDAAPDALCEAVRLQRARLKTPPMTPEAPLARPETAGLALTASRLRPQADRL